MATRNPQAFTRTVECAEELRTDLPRLSFDAGYCIDAPEYLPAGSEVPFAWSAVVRGGQWPTRSILAEGAR